MYKIFLCLHYLRSRVIAYFAVLGVMLCVAMMLIVICVMNGFLRKIESAAKGLFGDIVIEAASSRGVERYDEFIKFIKQGPHKIREVEAASPFIISHAFLRVPDLPGYFRPVQVVGIRLPERAEVSDFEEGLFVQAGLTRPTFDPPMELILRRVEEDANRIQTILRRQRKRAAEDYDDAPDEVKALLAHLKKPHTRSATDRPWITNDHHREIGHLEKLHKEARKRGDDEQAKVLGDRILRLSRLIRLEDAYARNRLRRRHLQMTGDYRREIDRLEKLHGRAKKRGDNEQAEVLGDRILRLSRLIRLEDAYARSRLAIRRLQMTDDYRREIDRLEKLREQAQARDDDEQAEAMEDEILGFRRVAYGPPESRAILGVGIPALSFRTKQGELIRCLWPGSKIVLKVVPLGRYVSEMDLQLPRGMFSVCDDSRTGVSSIDRDLIYLPFKRLQVMNSMDQPDRCTQIHIKVRDPAAGGVQLREIADKVEIAWKKFDKKAGLGQQVSVQTWRERQRRVIAPIEAQRTLVIIMFGIISLVSVFLIFVIFYMIAFQKTREIGLIKAIGGSNAGVAQIFLAYGAVVGLIGAVLGTTAGYVFVRNINPIHDWVARTFGLVVWDREVFMFDLIPNEVRWGEAGAIALGAVVFGILGALLPSIVAARMQPVEALRYE